MRKHIYTLLLSSLCFSGFGQSSSGSSNLLPSITRPSPTVAALMKVEESSLDHYTGQPQISVPLFSTKAGNLDVNLALSYNSSGIRITETSGWTGKGWSLETGGVISRSVVDLPDEINTDNHKGANVNGLHNFFDYLEDSIERRSFAYNAQWGTQVDLDTKSDVYQFSFFGRSGRFVFVKTGNVLVPAIIGNDGNYKIEAGYTTNPTPSMYPKEITSFVITDDTGYRYYFTEIERTSKKDISFTYMQEGCDNPTAPNESPSIGKFISAWHLSKVEDANGIKLLDITYANILEKPNATESRTDYVAENLHTIFSDSQSCTEYMRCALEPRTITSQSFRDIESKKISSISFPDGSSIQFSISASHPEYREGKGTYLTGITIYNGKETLPIRTFDFNYYTALNALFLENVKTNNSDIEKYTFEYYNKQFYPLFNTLNRDIFGYANSVAMQTGVLSKITYPTKGVREFAWEPNTYSYKGDKLLSFVEIFNNPDNYTTAGVSHLDVFMNDSHATTRPYTLFQVNFEQEATVYSATTYSGATAFTMPNFVMIVPVLNTPGYPIDTNRADAGYPINTNQSIDRTVHLKPGLYKAYFRSLNVTISNTEKISGSLDILVKNPTQHLNWFLYGGGIRIKTAKDSDRTVDQIIKGYAYNFENPGTVPSDLPPYLISPGGSYTLSFSSGSLDGIDNLTREYSVDITPIFNQLFRTYSPPPVTYHVSEKQNEMEAQLQKGNFIGYKNVFEYFYPNVSSIENPIYKSKIKYVFDSPIDFPSLITTSNPPLPIRGDEYKQGNVRKIDYLTATNSLVVSEDFKYNYDTGSIKTFVKKNVYFIPNTSEISDLCQQIRKLYVSYSNLQSNFISAAQYAIDCDGAPSTLAGYFQGLDKSECLDALSENYMAIDDYRYKSQVVEQTKKEYLPTVALESKQTYSYRDDNKRLFMQTSLSSTGETLTTKYFYPPDSEMASAPFQTELTARNIIGSPLRTEVFRNSELLSVQETHYGSFTLPSGGPTPPLPGNALLPQYIYTAKGTQPIEKRITFSSYDSRGNITQYVQQNGPATSFVWGYGKTLPLAKLENIEYSNIPTGLISAAQNASDASGVSYSETTLLTALENLRNDTTLAGSMVTAYAYLPLVGISATIDAKGERTTYVYDSFGRLKAVKDRDGRMLSQNSYHYRTQN